MLTTRRALRLIWLLSALTCLGLPGCLGGQTGDPTAACGGIDPSELLRDFQGVYTAPVVQAYPPGACVDPDAVLIVEVGEDLGESQRGECGGVSSILVDVHVSSDAGLDHDFAAWIDAYGHLVPANGERFDPSVAWDGSLVVRPTSHTFELSSPTYSTLPACCSEESNAFDLGEGGAAGAAGAPNGCF